MFRFKAFADNNFNVAPMVLCQFKKNETLWEKEKMLVTNIFSFSYNVFSKTFSSGASKPVIV